MKNNILVLIRHGESEWNLKNKFTGWVDIDLSKNGIIESKKVGNVIKSKNLKFDISYSSLLKRSIHTLWNILTESNQEWIKFYKSWRLNERHYGLLQGLDKNEASKKYGDYQIKMWRRSLKETPPKILVSKNDYYNNRDIKYKKLSIDEYPNSESLESTINRVKPFWENVLLYNIFMKKNVLIVAHGNSIRALMQIIHKMKEEDIISLEIPTAVPYIYEFNNSLNLIKNYSL